jgi:phosphatidate cytidylyltransferase
VEGALGGIAAAIIAALLLNLFVHLAPYWLIIIIAIVVSVAGQLGDLCESAVKRWARVKDSGTLIPGHGGILDRFDSMFFAAPTTYLIFSIYQLFV